MFSPLTREQEENWFFELSRFQERLEQLFDDHKSFVMPVVRYNEAKSFIDSGLQDISLSRARMHGACRSRGTPRTSSTCGLTRC